MAGKSPSNIAPPAAKPKGAPKAAAPQPNVAKPSPEAIAKPAARPVIPFANPEPPVVEAAPVAQPAPVAEPAPIPVAAEAPVAPEPPTPEAVAPEPAPAPVIEAATPAADPVVTTAAEPVAAAAATVIQKDIKTMEATIINAAEQVQDKARTAFADVNDRTKTAMEKGSKMIEDMNEFSKGNVEALVESSKIAAKGVEAMGQDAAEYSRRQFESATAALKSMSAVKSPTELFKLQSDYMRSAFDAMVAETSKNTESMLKLAGEIAQPISNRVAVAAEKVKLAA